MDNIIYFRYDGGYIGLSQEDVNQLERFDREFLGLVLAEILEENERWDYINDCLRDAGIIDECIYITGRC